MNEHRELTKLLNLRNRRMADRERKDNRIVLGVVLVILAAYVLVSI